MNVRQNPWRSREMRGQVAFTLPASAGAEFVELDEDIPQTMPVGGVVAGGFDDDSAALPVFVGGMWNNIGGKLKIRLYFLGPYAGGLNQFHYVIMLHTGPPY